MVETETKRKAGPKKFILLGIWIALLVGVVVWINLAGKIPPPAPPKPPAAPNLDAGKLAAQWPQIVAHAAAPPRGRADTRYTFAEFGDFQCPQCGKARPQLEGLLTKYPTQVNLIFLHRPFPQIHQWALPSGQAAEIAAAQGKFWPMYDVLYTHQGDLEPGFYGDYAVKAGLNKAAFQKAFDAGQGAGQVAAATKFSDSLSIQETPTILLYDSVAKTVTIYMGLYTKDNADQGIPYPGLDTLTASPPWPK